MGGKGSGRKSIIPTRHTNYMMAWQKFKTTPEYTRAVEMLSNKGMIQPFIDNWIQSLFGAGFTASGVKVEFV